MEGISQHRHCRVCSKVCDWSQETCSRACREKREDSMRTRRLYTGVMYAMMVFLAIVVLIFYLR